MKGWKSRCWRNWQIAGLRKEARHQRLVRRAEREKTPRERLRHKLALTASARFGAANRLEARERRLTRLTAFSSAYLIVLTVLPYFLTVPEGVEDRINLIAATFAIIVLASSLLQASSGNSAKAEQLHRGAMELNEIERDLSLENSDRANRRANDRYSVVLQKFSVNHAQIDIDRVMLNRPHEFPWLRGITKWMKLGKWWGFDMLPNLFLGLITAAFLALVFSYALPNAEGGPLGLTEVKQEPAK